MEEEYEEVPVIMEEKPKPTMKDIIRPIDSTGYTKTGKPRKKYKASEETLRKRSERMRKMNEENNKVLKQYKEVLHGTKSLSKEDVDDLLGRRFAEMELKLQEKLKPAIVEKSPVEVPKAIETIPEDDTYQSEGGTIYKRVNTRFQKAYDVPVYSRFRNR